MSNVAQSTITLRGDLAVICETLDAILKQAEEMIGSQPETAAASKEEEEPYCMIDELQSTVLTTQRKVNALKLQMDRIYERL